MKQIKRFFSSLQSAQVIISFDHGEEKIKVLAVVFNEKRQEILLIKNWQNSKQGWQAFEKEWSILCREIQHRHLGTPWIISHAPSRSLFSRFFSVKTTSAKATAFFIQNSAKTLLPYPIDESIHAIVPIVKEKYRKDFLLFSLHRPYYDSLIKTYLKSGIILDQLSCEPLSLLHFFCYCFPNMQKAIFFYIDQTHITGLVIRGNAIIDAQYLKRSKEEDAKDIVRILYGWNQEKMIQKETPLFGLTTSGEQPRKELEETIAQHYPWSPWRWINQHAPKERVSMLATSFSHAVAWGTILEIKQRRDEKTNLLLASDRPSYEKKHLSSAIQQTFFCCLTLAGLILSIGFLTWKQKEMQLKTRMEDREVVQLIKGERSASVHRLFSFTLPLPSLSHLIYFLNQPIQEYGASLPITYQQLHYQLAYPSLSSPLEQYKASLSLRFSGEEGNQQALETSFNHSLFSPYIGDQLSCMKKEGGDYSLDLQWEEKK